MSKQEEIDIPLIKGKAWLFGDNVDTDQISPGKALVLPMEEQVKLVLVSPKPGFPDMVSPGDVIVAGKNFGCGSSREHAAGVIKELGVGAVIAESFGRIFFRNSVAIGLPVLAVPMGSTTVNSAPP